MTIARMSEKILLHIGMKVWLCGHANVKHARAAWRSISVHLLRETGERNRLRCEKGLDIVEKSL